MKKGKQTWIYILDFYLKSKFVGKCLKNLYFVIFA